jgi:transposase
MVDVIELAGTLFSGLPALVIDDVGDADGVICVRARTRDEAVACPACGTETARVHGYHGRTAAGVPAGGRRVLVKVRIRRMRCPVPGCTVQAFREQVPGVLDRCQRRTTRLARQVSAVVRELAGRAGARLLPALGIFASRHTALRVLLRVPLPAVTVPRVPGIGDFSLLRGQVCATVLTGAGTGRRVDVLPGRTADLVGEWLLAHPGVQVVCRDGSGAYGEAVRRALPAAVQVSDRWHLRHGLAEAVQKEAAAHSACRAAAPLQAGKRAGTKLERWQQIHDLLSKDTGLRECARRLDLSIKTVRRYARADRPERLQRARQYRSTLAGPYRDHLRKRRAEEPGVPVLQLLREIREPGCPGSRALLVQYIAQGRAGAGRPDPSPRRAARLMLTRPGALTASQQEALTAITAACPEMTAAASLVRSFAALLTPHPRNARRLQKWITAARAADLPRLHAFTRGLDLDSKAATAALTLPHHNGRTEGANTKTKMIKRQMYGRAGFTLLRHRILLS